MDFVLSVHNFPLPGETIKGKALLVNPGGKGGNQAVAAARMKVPVYAIGKVGTDDLARIAVSIMGASGVQLDFVSQVDDEPTGVALIWVNEEGQNIIGFYPGATLKLTTEDIARALEAAEEGDVLLCTFEVAPDIVFYALKKAKSKGMLTILNPAPAEPIPEGIFEFIDVLTPNESEVYKITGTRGMSGDLSQVIKAVQRILKQHPRCSMAVTLGDKGCVYVTENSWRTISAIKVEKIVDTTAAGDAFNGSFAAFIASDKDILTSLKLANIAGALSVGRLGAQKSMPYIDEIHDVYEEKS